MRQSSDLVTLGAEVPELTKAFANPANRECADCGRPNTLFFSRQVGFDCDSSGRGLHTDPSPHQFGVTLCYQCSTIHAFVLGDTISEIITLAQLQNDPYRVRRNATR